jgi:hypothetical protein
MFGIPIVRPFHPLKPSMRNSHKPVRMSDNAISPS